MFEQRAVAENAFLADVNALRAQVRPILDTPSDDAKGAIALLQTVLSAEIACVLRYTNISVSPDGLKNGWIGKEFQEQANDERRHMALAAERIAQLGGVPDFSTDMLKSRESAGASGFARNVTENLAAEQSVIAHYRELITYFEPRDAQSCAILRDIIRDEEDHTNDMQDLLASYAG
jgi:bacterioferritin